MAELSPTGSVVLGMLGLGPKSGYDIKRFVDHSTRFFWAASYGQIYPELRRLADAGLISGEEEPRGGRARTVFRLTPTGRRELERWLSEAPQTHEMRDESLLKLFFSEAAGGGPTTIRALEQKAAHHREVAKSLRGIQAEIRAQYPETAELPENSKRLTLRFGIDFNDWIVGWCEREAERLADTGTSTGPEGGTTR